MLFPINSCRLCLSFLSFSSRPSSVSSAFSIFFVLCPLLRLSYLSSLLLSSGPLSSYLALPRSPSPGPFACLCLFSRCWLSRWRAAGSGAPASINGPAEIIRLTSRVSGRAQACRWAPKSDPLPRGLGYEVHFLPSKSREGKCRPLARGQSRPGV